MPQHDEAADPGKSRTAAAAVKSAPAQSYWRSFPALEKALQQDNPPLLGRIQETCRKLDGILKSGSPQEKSRAQSAMTAYTRGLELYRELVNRRDQALALAQASNRGKAPHDK